MRCFPWSGGCLHALGSARLTVQVVKTGITRDSGNLGSGDGAASPRQRGFRRSGEGLPRPGAAVASTSPPRSSCLRQRTNPPPTESPTRPLRRTAHLDGALGLTYRSSVPTLSTCTTGSPRLAPLLNLLAGPAGLGQPRPRTPCSKSRYPAQRSGVIEKQTTNRFHVPSRNRCHPEPIWCACASQASPISSQTPP